VIPPPVAAAAPAPEPTGPSKFDLIKDQVHAGSLPTNYKKIIEKFIARGLIDAESRRIEWDSTPHGGLVCGKVNAKNRMGGYTGFKWFVAGFDSSKELLGISIEGEDFTSDDMIFAINLMEPECIQADPSL
jgi:hypothetical protein